MGRVRPTVMTGVPRVYEKLQARILEKGHSAAGGAKAARSSWARRRSGWRAARAMLRGRHRRTARARRRALAERLVFSKIREALGGRLRFSRPAARRSASDVVEFFYGIGIADHRGLRPDRDVADPDASIRSDAPRVGTVGRPLPGVEVRIAEDGEILARGPNMMRGYYNKPEATADGARGTAGSTPATSARSTPTAT